MAGTSPAMTTWKQTSAKVRSSYAIALQGRELVMIRKLSRCTISAMLVISLQGCEKKQNAADQPIRGLRAYKVAATAESRVRRFPSVLQPADVSSLSFEIGGQLKAVTLTVG